MYSPRLGSFASRDPLETPTLRGRYAYVDGNPVNRTDASGMCPESVRQTALSAGYIASSTIRQNGYVAQGIANTVCAAYDLAPFAGAATATASAAGLTVTAHVLAAGTTAATAGVLLATGAGVLVGLGIYLWLTTATPLLYTPDQLADMRPPTPQPIYPVGTAVPLPQPQVQLLPTAAPQPAPTLAPNPTPCPHPTPTQTPQERVNLDTSTLIGLVAFNPTNVSQTASIRAEIMSLINGRQMVVTNTAVREFITTMVSAPAGHTEIANAAQLALQLYLEFDNPSPRFQALTPGGSLGRNDIIILGTGDQLRIETLTGDARAIGGIQGRGILDFRYRLHTQARLREVRG